VLKCRENAAFLGGRNPRKELVATRAEEKRIRVGAKDSKDSAIPDSYSLGVREARPSLSIEWVGG